MRSIRLIIFDMDGTLYNLDDVVSMNYNMQLDFYSDYFKTDKAFAKEIFERNCIFPTITDTSKSATEFFLSLGVQAYEWNGYREEHFDVECINLECAVDNITLLNYKKIAPLVLLSSNSMKNVFKILGHLGIDRGIFNDIVCSDHKYSSGRFRKVDEMQLISKRFDISPTNILSIGDRYKTDIEPILSLGGIGALINKPSDLKKLIKDIEEEKFFRNGYIIDT